MRKLPEDKIIIRLPNGTTIEIEATQDNIDHVFSRVANAQQPALPFIGKLKKGKTSAICDICGKPVTNLSLHKAKTHPSEKPNRGDRIECPQCGKLVTRQYLPYHIQRKHHEVEGKKSSDTGLLLQCSLCNEPMKNERGLSIHMAKRHGVKGAKHNPKGKGYDEKSVISEEIPVLDNTKHKSSEEIEFDEMLEKIREHYGLSRFTPTGLEMLFNWSHDKAIRLLEAALNNGVLVYEEDGRYRFA